MLPDSQTGVVVSSMVYVDSFFATFFVSSKSMNNLSNCDKPAGRLNMDRNNETQIKHCANPYPPTTTCKWFPLFFLPSGCGLPSQLTN